jgi:hypothetical protein
MKALIYLFHCLPRNARRYRDELERRGLDAEVIPIVKNGFSSVYRSLAAQERTSSYISGLLKHHPPQRLDPLASDTAIVLASWSAGYGYPITLLAEESSAERIDGIVFIDSCYSSIDRGTGKVLHAGLLPIKRFAMRARETDGTQVLWHGYADVPTSYERHRGWWEGYGSTQQTAEELVRWVGGKEGGFYTKFFDTKRGPRGNHMAAMLEWGPGWLAAAVEQIYERRRSAGLEPTSDHDDDAPPAIDSVEETDISSRRDVLRMGDAGPVVEEWQQVLLAAGHSLRHYGADGQFGPLTASATRSYQAERELVADGIVGPITWGTVEGPERQNEPTVGPIPLDTVGKIVLQVSQELKASGVAEIPGPGAHPVILAAFACCERGGRVGAVALQSDEYAWCAAFFSYCQLEAERRLGLERADTGFIPRAAVWELHRDAVVRGGFHDAAEARCGEYTPRPGDAWIQVRGGYDVGPTAAPFTHSGGLGHVGRVVRWEGEMGETIDGNINNTVSVVQRSLSDHSLVGFIEQ